MSPEEKKTILQFMGQTYGQTHKLDQDIVGTSQFLKPTSGAMREKFEEVLRAPIQEKPIGVQSIQYVEPVLNSEPNITTSYHQEEYNVTSPTAPYNEPLSQTLQDSGEISKVLTEINLNLIRIGDILEKATNVRTKKIKNTGSE